MDKKVKNCSNISFEDRISSFSVCRHLHLKNYFKNVLATPSVAKRLNRLNYLEPREKRSLHFGQLNTGDQWSAVDQIPT